MTPRPKTAKVQVEIVFDDGSKEIVTSELLDASRLPDHIYSHTSRDPEDYPTHIVAGMEDPFKRDEDWFGTRRYSQPFHLPPLDDHFFLRMRLPAYDKNNRTVYTIQKVEAPQTRVIMVWTGGQMKVCSWTEEEAQLRAEQMLRMGAIYFFLDIP